MDAEALCREMLPATSRTFALTIPALPLPLRTTVGLAYLLCRIADTIEDQVALPLDERLYRFDLLRRLLTRPRAAEDVSAFEACWLGTGDHPDQRLARRTREVLSGLDAVCDQRTQRIVFGAVAEMVDGMADMCRRTPIDAAHYPNLETTAELEEYCHYVAGTVGIMLTRLFDAHMGSAVGFDSSHRRRQGRDFGLGLQLTNILKDYVDDYAAGRCFLPSDVADRFGVGRSCPAEGPLPHSLRRQFAGGTVDRLASGMQFIRAIPGQHVGLRTFCIWDLFLALETLGLIAGTAEGGTARKISRDKVYAVVQRGRDLATDDDALDHWFATLVHDGGLRYLKEPTVGANGVFHVEPDIVHLPSSPL